MANSTTLVCRHATPARNLKSIFRTGLQPGLATGKLKVCWLHQPKLTRWAVSHVAEKHHTPERNIAVLEIHIPLSDLRHRSDGVWVCDRVIRPEEIHGVNSLRIAIGT